MSKIDDLNIQPKFDNALQVQRTANIPNNEKYTASEWNSLIAKTNEVVGRANINTWSIVTNYSELPADPVNSQKVYVTGTSLSGHVGVQMMPNGNSSRGFYVYDAFSDIWVQKTSESELDTRLSNLADDLDETEQETIKYKLDIGDYNGVTPTVTENVITSYNIDPQLETEHWNLTMAGDTDFDFTNMFDTDNSKVITITLKGDYAFTFPSWLKPLETNDEYDTIEGSLVAEIVINIKKGGANPSGYYSLQMIDYAL